MQNTQAAETAWRVTQRSRSVIDCREMLFQVSVHCSRLHTEMKSILVIFQTRCPSTPSTLNCTGKHAFACCCKAGMRVALRMAHGQQKYMVLALGDCKRVAWSTLALACLRQASAKSSSTLTCMDRDENSWKQGKGPEPLTFGQRCRHLVGKTLCSC